MKQGLDASEHILRGVKERYVDSPKCLFSSLFTHTNSLDQTVSTPKDIRARIVIAGLRIPAQPLSM